MSVDGLYSEPEDEAVLGVLGIDPGPHTGIFAAWWALPEGRLLNTIAFECTMAKSAGELRNLLGLTGIVAPVRLAGIEAFVPRMRATRLAGVQAAKIMGQVRELSAICEEHGVRVIARPAGLVKPWIKAEGDPDARLRESGLLAIAKAAPHTKPGAVDVVDAARHCLFTACQAGLPDPLSAIARNDGHDAAARPG